MRGSAFIDGFALPVPGCTIVLVALASLVGLALPDSQLLDQHSNALERTFFLEFTIRCDTERKSTARALEGSFTEQVFDRDFDLLIALRARKALLFRLLSHRETCERSDKHRKSQ